MIRQYSIVFMAATLVASTLSGIWAAKGDTSCGTRFFWASSMLFLLSVSIVLYSVVAPWAAAIPAVPSALFALIFLRVRRGR